MQKGVLNLIGDANLEKVFITLSDFGDQVNDQSFLKELALLEFRFNTIKKEKLRGTYMFRELNTELNQVAASLIDLISENDEIKKIEKLSTIKSKVKSAVEKAKQKSVGIAEKISATHDFGEKQYLADWYKSNFQKLSKEVTNATFDLLEMEGKDEFEFKQTIIDSLRLILKSYLNKTDEWLKKPEFIYDFVLFSKSEYRTSLTFLSKELSTDEKILKEDRLALAEFIKVLDSGIKGAVQL